MNLHQTPDAPTSAINQNELQQAQIVQYKEQLRNFCQRVLNGNFGDPSMDALEYLEFNCPKKDMNDATKEHVANNGLKWITEIVCDLRS